MKRVNVLMNEALTPRSRVIAFYIFEYNNITGILFIPLVGE